MSRFIQDTTESPDGTYLVSFHRSDISDLTHASIDTRGQRRQCRIMMRPVESN